MLAEYPTNDLRENRTINEVGTVTQILMSELISQQANEADPVTA